LIAENLHSPTKANGHADMSRVRYVLSYIGLIKRCEIELNDSLNKLLNE